MTRVPVSPEMLRWACERVGYDMEQVAARIPQFPAWIRRERHPTLKQLEKFAKLTHTPFGHLFLSKPPNERLPVPDYRTVTGTARQRPSPDLLDTLYTMQIRQEWLREVLVENDAEPLAFVESARLADDPEAVGREMRRVLGLDGGWAAGVHTWQDAVSELRRMIEQLGVMAVINGVVGNNPHRRLSVDEFRGFALTDPYAPLIFVNGADAKSAQMFTLAHELAHIWLGTEGLSGFKTLFPGGTDVEDWCNRAAAEFLAPARELRVRWQEVMREAGRFEVLARTFKVSPIVAARRALDLNLVDQNAFFDFYEHHTNREHEGGKTPDGGNFYNNQNTRVGKLFTLQVLSAAMEGRIGFEEAYDLTGLRGGTFQAYARRLGVNVS
ncbi:MAG: ImmA/IrrE family metallo-endopeptidase [Caldilineaceae bacterium SB0662_bin_9]|uniref:ImmA/IrrE family metallo-endopeptidase n=1 Tax=Caldilineaceae bacterium SB0662_bin_9 TaxID=2605258 RepID=A0A6B1DX52_9CHLR|nr:ImmA/IrrE family metallo-endopeptidase [Caldilineaceae bacterium SB0662_bin_9]